MKNIAYRKKYLVREAVGVASLNEAYRIIDPEDNTAMAEVREESNLKQKIAKLFFDKAFLPAKLVMYSPEGEKLLEINQPASLFKSTFTVTNSDNRVLCVLRQKLSLFNPQILVEDGNGQLLGKIKGGWKFKTFQFIDNNQNILATIRHRIMGLAKELFTTADDFEVTMNSDASMALITLASVICIDFMYHES
jgi:uncharacterized protein YxjI